MKNVCYLSVLVHYKNNVEVKKKNGYPVCHMTQKFSQSHFPIQTQSQRRSEGPRPRGLTKTLEPSSQVPLEHTKFIEIQTLFKM